MHKRAVSSVSGMVTGVAFLLVMAGGVAFKPTAAIAALGTDDPQAEGEAELAHYFGFDESRIVVVDDDCGPMVVDDMNGDGRPDLIVANNRKSRIEIHELREEKRSDTDAEQQHKVNELPPNPWYDRREVSVAHRVTALRVYDVDGDGKKDILYVGSNPSELVIMRQLEKGATRGGFEQMYKRRVSDLAANQDGFHIADVSGDAAPEIVTLADGKMNVFPFAKSGVIGDPVPLGSDGKLVALFIEDYNGDGLQDVMGAVPDDAAPVRVWLQKQDPRSTGKNGMLTSELRFEMPQLAEAEAIRFPNRPAASIGVIERASRRIVFYDLSTESINPADLAKGGGGGERDVQAEVSGFSDGSSSDRSVAVADIDGDGMQDLLATDAKANTLVFYRQAAGIGLSKGEPFSAFKKPKSVVVGYWGKASPAGGTAGTTPEVFVLSEEEKAVGVCKFDRDTGRLSFPTPITTKTSGASPVAIGFVDLGESGGGGALAIVLKDRRDHTLELHLPDTEGGDDAAGKTRVITIPLKNVSRPPQSMLAADADQDGRTDLLLFTPSEPMVMVRNTGDPDPEKAWEVLTDEEMKQFGLVQAAGPDNTALVDFDGNGSQDLLIADENFVRACSYDPDTGWRVVEQVTVPDVGTKFAGVTTMTDAGTGEQLIVASDKGNGRLVLMSPKAKAGTSGGGSGGGGGGSSWGVTERLRLRGFPLGAIFAGHFTGETGKAAGPASILCISGDGFAQVRLAGQRSTLEEFAAYRSDAEDRFEHELEAGDLNGDGYLDAVVLDAKEQVCSIFTFSAARRLYMATEFEVYQSRLFSGGSSREFEPRAAEIVDATGDGRADLILTVHDRLIVYPQATKPQEPKK